MAELPQEFFNRIKDACRLAEEKAYQQGRADKYQEITSEYMLLTENQVEEIRADVIDEYKGRLLDLCGGGEECIECVGGNCTGCLENSVDYSSIVDLAEELKEQKKCPNGKNPHWTCYEVCEHRENGICTLNN